MKTQVDFVVDPLSESVYLFNKKLFKKFFDYDDFVKENVRKNINVIDRWKFIEPADLIKEKCEQKNVYRNLAKVFEDEEYLSQIEKTSPKQLKRSLLKNCPKNFNDDDFRDDYLVATERNLEQVMKMLAKEFKFNFFTNHAEE